MPLKPEHIEYRRAMLKGNMMPEGLPARIWRGEEIPEEAKKAIDDEDLLNLGGTYRDKLHGTEER